MQGPKTKKELSQKPREQLLRALKARFEKNMNRHKGLLWAKLQAKLEANTEKLWSLNEMKKTAVNRMLLAMIKRRANTFFMIVQRKVLKAAQAFVTTAKAWNRGKYGSVHGHRAFNRRTICRPA